MARLSKKTSPQAAVLADELRKNYGGMLNLAGVKQVLGVTDDRTAKKFLEGVPHYDINGRARWMVTDVARKLDEARCATC